MSRLRLEDRQKLWLGQVLSCNRDGRLAVMEYEAGIEQVTGHRLGSGHRQGSGREFGLGINSTSPLRLNPMRPLTCNDQVFKLHSLV